MGYGEDGDGNSMTEHIITRATLAILETLFYGNQQGWYAITTTGSRK